MPGRASAFLALGTLDVHQADMEALETHSQGALDLSRTLGDRLREGRALSYLGWAAASRSDLGEARRLLDDAVRALDTPGGEYSRQRALSAIAVVLFELGDHAGALARQRELIARTRHRGSDAFLANTLNTLGQLERLAGSSSRRDGRWRNPLH